VASRTKVEIEIERAKAAQSAATFGMDDLPPQLRNPMMAVRLGKTEKSDEVLVGKSGARGLLTLTPGHTMVNFGRSETTWATQHNRRRAGKAPFLELIAFARQVVGLSEDGRVAVLLMGHPGAGPVTPLWGEREDLVVSCQPNDILMRYEELKVDLW
jgi:hypothetical protein